MALLRPLFGPRSGSVPAGDFAVTGPYAASYVPTALLKTQLHCHTTGSSDGSIAPATMVGNYVAASYDALALTDHDNVTSQPAGADYAIVGSELSPTGHHLISLDSTYTRGATTASQDLIDGVVAAGGQVHLAHPLWYAGFSQSEMASLSGHFGFEIHNGICVQGAGRNPLSYPGYALARWDALLTAGQRSGVWGVAVDDLHSVSAYKTYDMGCVKVFVESASVDNIVAALVAGNFVADVSNFGITPGYPVRGASDVSLTCTNATRIEAWGRSGRFAYANDDNLTVDYPFDGGAGYCRFVAYGDYTEPFDSLSDRWGVQDGSWGVSSGVLSISDSGSDTAHRIILRRHRAGDFTAQTDLRVTGSGLPRNEFMFNVLDTDYYFIIHIGQSGSAQFHNKLAIAKATGGTFGTPLASTDFTPTLNTWYTVKMAYAADTGTIQAKVWATGDSEPDWMLEVADTTWTWGSFGYRANRTCSMDNLYIDGFQTFYQPLFIDPA